jgi:cell division septation protein DedD
MARKPSPRDDAARRGRADDRARDEQPRLQRRQDPDDAPWLDEADYEEGAIHTLVGRRTLWAMLFALGVLAIGVVVGILLVSKRETTPIDVPAVGAEVPVLASPGPWKLKPSGPDVDGVPVEGQGQLLFGTGDGQDTEARIAMDALPEDPMPRPGTESGPLPADQPAAAAPLLAGPPAPRDDEKPAPEGAPPKRAQPKIIYAPGAESGAPADPMGRVLQLGAFSSDSRARQAFKSLSERLSYLNGLEPLVVPIMVEGKTLYRLRTTAGTPAEARNICDRLKVAGEACTLVN